MHYFEVRRKYPLWPILNPTIDEVISRWYKKEFRSCIVPLENKARIDAIRKTDEEINANCWRIQGEILGQLAGE